MIDLMDYKKGDKVRVKGSIWVEDGVYMIVQIAEERNESRASDASRNYTAWSQVTVSPTFMWIEEQCLFDLEPKTMLKDHLFKLEEINAWS